MEKRPPTQRQSRPPQLLTYPVLGEPAYTAVQAVTKKKNPPPPGTFRAASHVSHSPSQMSIRSRQKTLELDRNAELDQLTVPHLEYVELHNLQIRKKKREVQVLEKVAATFAAIPVDQRTESDTTEHGDVTVKLAILRKEVVELEDEVETATRIFKMKKGAIQRGLLGDKKKLQIEADEANEQSLDSDEENIRGDWEGADVTGNTSDVNNQEPHLPFPPIPPGHRSSQQDDLQLETQSNYYSTAQHPTSNDDVNVKMLQLMNTQMLFMEKGSAYHHDRNRDLPIFSGKAEEWPIFVNEYERTTPSSPSKGEKSAALIRLRKALKGPAKDAVLGLLDDPESLPAIIMKLKNRFGRPEFILKALIAKVREAKPPKVDNPASIIQFGTEVQNLVIRVKAMKETRYLYDITLLEEIVSKLPHSYGEQWIMWLRSEPSRERNLSTFADWIELKVAVAEELHQPTIPDETKKEDRRDIRKHGVHAAGAEANPKTASKQDIPLLKNLGLDDRYKVVKEHRLCYLCLKRGHSAPKCQSERRCDIDNCGMPHHRLLHRPPSGSTRTHGTNQPSRNDSNRTSENAESTSALSAPPMDGVANMSTAQCSGSLPIIPVWVTGPKGRKKIYALLDTGASFTMLEDGIAKELGLTGREEKLNFTVYGDRRSESSSVVTFGISGTHRNAKEFPIKNGHTMPKLGIPGITVNAEELKRKYPHLRRMKTKSLENAVPQMLLGYDQYSLFFAKFVLEPRDNMDDPYAFKCKLGWYIMLKDDLKTIALAHNFNVDDELHETVKQFFSTEAFGTKPILNSERSKEDKRAMDLLEKNTTRKGNRWETCLLWKEDHSELPESKGMAMTRLRGMERKMDSDHEFASLVEKKFDDYISKGYLIPRTKIDVEKTSQSNRKWYLPWFFAYHPTKKPRLVFDAAAKSKGMSLNDYLLKGPDLLNPLPAVLTRFRRHKVALTGDIREMFHQVLLRKEDWPSQTILYRGRDRQQEPQEYYMSVLFFGSASSPCSAIFAKNRNAEEFRGKYPVAVEAIQNNFYMDDFLGGAETEIEAIQLREQITQIHLAGGFEIVKWNSSSETVWKSIPADIRAEGNISFMDKDDVYVEKTLGMYWSPSQDQFCFKLNFHRVKPEVSSGERIPTKREMTSLIMAVFDPLGFLAPLKVKALILIQEVWRSAIGWDDQIPVNVFQKWKLWLKLLQDVDAIKIIRRLTTMENPEKIEMHVFCDASEEAFASAAYLTFTTGGRREVTFVTGKSRVAPLRGLTVPKMELQAALLGSRLARTIRSTFGDSIRISKTTFWSNSMSVLCQIRSSTLRYKTFESNRIGEILELTDVNQWKWISTDHNVADDATRSSSTLEMSSKCRWLTGSNFLSSPQEEWPKHKSMPTGSMPLEEMGVKVISAAVTSPPQYCSSPFPDLHRFSSYYRLLRATAFMFGVIRRLRKAGPYHVTGDDLKKAETQLFRKSQQESFPEEFQALKNGMFIPKGSRLYSLSPKLNEDGLIVLDGRINAAPDVPAAVRSPAILSPKHHLTKLLIHHHHEKNHHQGQEKVVNDLRQESWIVDCRAAVRSCWAKCMTCKLRRTHPRQPEMGQIPVARLGESHFPFHNTGVDYFGPMTVSIGRKLHKRWGALFTCLTTRAVHLELVDSLDTSDMINALVRFTCLRGKPAHIWSDNGTNFIGAKREVNEAWKKLDQDEIRNKMVTRQIQWHNIPPSSPFMGGAWESLGKIVKRILTNMLKEQHPRESTLRTLFAEVTEIMNDRPLTYASSCPEDPDCLTPNALLRLRSIPGQSIPGEYHDGDKFRKSWRYGQYLADEFWRRWVHVYLPKLAKRDKWQEKAEPLQVGDVVLVVDDQSPRSAWRKGIITAVFPGKDHQVRVVDVKVAHVKEDDPKKKVFISHYRRPASKICPLGIRIAPNRWEGGIEAADIN